MIEKIIDAILFTVCAIQIAFVFFLVIGTVLYITIGTTIFNLWVTIPLVIVSLIFGTLCTCQQVEKRLFE